MVKEWVRRGHGAVARELEIRAGSSPGPGALASFPCRRMFFEDPSPRDVRGSRIWLLRAVFRGPPRDFFYPRIVGKLIFMVWKVGHRRLGGFRTGARWGMEFVSAIFFGTGRWKNSFPFLPQLFGLRLSGLATGRAGTVDEVGQPDRLGLEKPEKN